MIQCILFKYCNDGIYGWYYGALHYTLEVEFYEFATNDYIKKRSLWLPPLSILTESCVFLRLLVISFVFCVIK